MDMKTLFRNFLFGKNNVVYFLTQAVIWVFNVLLIYILFF